jgi:GNAT superfamily N-acetyltransferase
MIRIRTGKAEDFDNIKNYLIDLWVMHAENEPDLLDKERIRNSNVKSYYQKSLENPEKSCFFVAEEENEIYGFIKIDIKKIDSFFKNPKILYIDDLFVMPKYRRKGVAKLLLNRVENLAKEGGIKRIQARVYAFNSNMHKLLVSQGYNSPYATWNKSLK